MSDKLPKKLNYKTPDGYLEKIDFENLSYIFIRTFAFDGDEDDKAFELMKMFYMRNPLIDISIKGYVKAEHLKYYARSGDKSSALHRRPIIQIADVDSNTFHLNYFEAIKLLEMNPL